MLSSPALQASGRSVLGRTSASEAANATTMSRFDQAAIDKNPFVLPTDEEAFAARDAEKRRKEELRETQRGLKLWDRTDFTSQLGRTRKMVEEIVPDVDPAALKKARESRGLVSAATAAIARERRRERETVQEFVLKKREMFMVQLSLDIKKEEIAKLEATAAAHEEALKKSELLLEEDAIRFDAFLKETDAAAHDALKKAEAAAKAKSDKLHELKKLKHNAGVVQAEKTKVREALEEYRRYKAFLDGLTPKEWVEERLGEQMAERQRRRKVSWEAKVEAWTIARGEKQTAIQAKVDADRKRALKLGQQPPKVDVQELVKAAMPPCPTLEEEPLPELSEQEQELPMYFIKPAQLAGLFAQLEESNLFLIGHCQDSEQQLEELRALHEETAAQMESQTASLEAEMQVLQATLASEEAKAAALRSKGADAGGDDGEAGGGKREEGGKEGGGLDHARALDSLLPALRTHIIEVYEKCGFKANASSEPVGMLTQLEGLLEQLLGQMSQLDPEYVQHKEKERERERRTRVREARLASAAKAHEQRQRKMLERAQAPVAKRTGKPVMYRSILPVKPKVVDTVDPEEERRKEEARYFS